MKTWLGSFAACIRSDFLKLKRTNALVLPLLLTAMVAIECALLASIEHTSRGCKQLLAQPLPRSAVYASKFAMMIFLVALAHGALFL